MDVPYRWGHHRRQVTDFELHQSTIITEGDTDTI